MKTKSFKIKLLVLAMLCVMLIAASSLVSIASAEEVPELPNTEVTETVDDKTDDGVVKLTLTEIFYNKILPVITNGAWSIGALLVVLIPFIKTLGSRNTYRTAYGTFKEKAGEYKELADTLTAKLTEISKAYNELKADFKDKLSEELSDGLSKIKTDVSEGLMAISNGTNKRIDEVAFNLALISEQTQQSNEAHALLWANTSGADVAVEKLSKSPNSRMVKRDKLKIRKLEEFVAQHKGEEAERILAEFDAAADAQYAIEEAGNEIEETDNE